MTDLNELGTINVTGGSVAVTGNGTAFALARATGGVLHAGAISVPVRSVEADNALTLALPWPGATETNLAYFIDVARAEATDLVAVSQQVTETARELRRVIYSEAEPPNMRVGDIWRRPKAQP